MLTAIGALGIGVLSTWDVAAPPASTGIDGTRMQARQASPAQPPVGE
jgi:hypothetical protein